MGLPKLTPRQERIVRFIAGYFADRQRMPTLREIGAAVGTPSPNGVRMHLNLIGKKGYMRVDVGGHKRSWEIVGLAAAIAPAVHAHVGAMIASATTPAKEIE